MLAEGSWGEIGIQHKTLIGEDTCQSKGGFIDFQLSTMVVVRAFEWDVLAHSVEVVVLQPDDIIWIEKLIICGGFNQKQGDI